MGGNHQRCLEVTQNTLKVDSQERFGNICRKASKMNVCSLEKQIRDNQREIDSISQSAQNSDRTLAPVELAEIAQLDRGIKNCREQLLAIEVGGCQ